jgi:hypothetical protein
MTALANSRLKVGTGMSSDGTRAADAKLLWRDCFDRVHLCSETDVRQAFLLLTTRCGRAVPPNARWPRDVQSPDCPDCQVAR